MSHGSNAVKTSLRIATGIVSILSAAAISTSPSHAFGNAYEVIDPKTAVVNEETVKSDDVKAGVSGIQSLITVVSSLKSDLVSNPQVDLLTTIKSELNSAKVRGVLNKFNTAFSEDTQRGTDRLIRNIIQDVTELERDTILKPGKDRADTKIAIIAKRLTATQTALQDLLAFYPK